MMMKKVIAIISIGLLSFSCTEDDSATATRLNVIMVDAPAAYDAVNVEVLRVDINYGNENDENGWQELDTEAGVYNLLDLTGGNEVLLVSNDIPAGTISQIRLVLGDNNSVIVGGDEFELKTPSGQSSGIKISLHQDFEEGIDYTVVLDFDASRSVLENPVRYTLKPVIRASLDALNGAIKGMIDPVTGEEDLYLINDLDTLSTTNSDSEGSFMFRGIPEGSYLLSVDMPETSIYSDMEVFPVEVSKGETTDLGSIILLEKLD